MTYQHRWKDGESIPLSLGKVVCIGRNYAEHARELNNPIPDRPILFIKPATSVVELEEPLSFPSAAGKVHYEAELAVLIGETLSNSSPAEALQAIVGIGLALDLTLRELQSQLKEKGHPWERAKAFDGACPLSTFLPIGQFEDLTKLRYALAINGEVRQQGDSAQMITPIAQLLAHASESFTLMPGDVVLTGTPAGVGVLDSGDQLELDLHGLVSFATQVAP